MNYGLGGIISTHSDTVSKKNLQEASVSHPEHHIFGGRRIVTFMLYLTDVELGGNTIFPHIGLSIKPVRGTALFWFNINSKMKLQRPESNHMGCPVLRGNKWIANKWIKLNAQFRHYKCNKKFSIH